MSNKRSKIKKILVFAILLVIMLAFVIMSSISKDSSLGNYLSTSITTSKVYKNSSKVAIPNSKTAELMIDKYKKDTVGKMASEFTLARLNGEIVQLSNLEGHNVVVELAESYCSGCIDSYKAVEEFKKSHKNIKVISIYLDANEKTMKTFFSQHDFTPDEEVIAGNGNSIGDIYKTSFTPTFLFIDKKEIIKNVIIGGTTLSDLNSASKKYLE